MASYGEGIQPTPGECADEGQQSQPSATNFSGCEDYIQPETAGHADEGHLKEAPRDFHSSIGCEGPSCEDPSRPSDNSDDTNPNNSSSSSSSSSSSDQTPAIPCSSDNGVTPEEDINKNIPRRRVSIAEVPQAVHYYEEKAAESDGQQSEEKKRFSLASTLSRMGSQTLASVVVVALMRLAAGLAFGFTGYVLPQLTQLSSTTPGGGGGGGGLVLPPQRVALFGSLVHLGAAVGTCCSEHLLSRVEQRTLLMLCTPAAALIWLLVYFSPYPWILLLTQFLLGITGAIILPCTMAYILEVQETARDKLSSIMHLARSVGGGLPFIIGISHIGWRELALINCGLTLLPALGIIILPVSPRWLLAHSKKSPEAQRALTFFRGGHLISEQEISTTSAQTQEISTTSVQIQVEKAMSTVEKLKHLFTPPTVQTFAKLILLTVTVAVCGGYTITAYLLLLLQNLETGIHPNIMAFIFFLTGTTGTTAYLCITHRWRQKTQLVVVFSFAAAFSVAMVCYRLLLSEGSISIIMPKWVTIVFILPFTFSMRLGETAFTSAKKDLLCVPLRKVGLQFLTVILHLAAFVACGLYPKIIEATGVAGLVSTFSVSCAATAIVCNCALPKTKNHTPQPITLNTATGETDDNMSVSSISTHL